MKNFKTILPVVVLFGIIMLAFTPNPNPTNRDVLIEKTSNQPEELGKVNWLRSFDTGIEQAEKMNKPIFLLFQEVPGCSTCRNYGNNVLSHPQIVEAIQTLFVPVAIFNNKKGKDAEVLRMFAEPAWNNPVVRIVSADKQNLIKRVSGNYSQLGIVNAMIQALTLKAIEVPTYLSLLHQELNAELTGTEKATFSMYCFWTGEKKLANVNGVLETQAGWMNGREVVEVKYNPLAVSYEELVEEASKASCASHVFTENEKQTEAAEKIVGNRSTSKKSKFRLDKEPKYFLSKSVYRFVPMTQLQAAKVNSSLGSRQSPDQYLSTRQLELLDFIKKHPNKKWESTINEDLTVAWEKVERKK